jgi:PBP1b-binding outer membrane lipoprotein LpoB
MKKLLPIIIILLSALFLASCSAPGGSVSVPSDETIAQINSALLSGYPRDVLPLYQPVALTSCSFSYRASDQYDIGKDIYSVNYQSASTQEDLIRYYSGLFTEKNENPSVEGDEITDKLSGKIGENNAEILFLDNEDSTTSVYLTLGLTSGQYVDSNPYFKGYPSDLVDAYSQTSLLEVTYEEQYYGKKTDHYITVYQTDMTQQAFIDYYNGKYAAKIDFTQTGSDNHTVFSWQDQGFDVDLSYSGGNTSYVTIDVSKAG